MNLDFILLVESGLLIMMAIGATALAHLEPTRRWSLLALFALTQVLIVWTRLIAVDLGEHDSSTAAEFLLHAGGIAILMEYVSAGTDALASRRHLSFAASLAFVFLGAAIAWIAGATTAAVFLCLAGTAVAIGAGWLLIRSARTWSASATAWRLRIIGGLLPLQVFTMSAPLALDARETADPFSLRYLIVPFAVSAALSLAVYFHNAALQSRRLPEAAARDWRRRRLLAFAAVWAVVIAGWLIADRSAKHQDAAMRRQILARTALAAASVDLADVRQLTWSETDVDLPGYLALKRLMISLHRANADVRFALLAGLHHRKSYFLVDSEPPESPDYSPPGQPYTEAATEYLDGMAGAQPFVVGPVEDRWGTWVLGSVPLLRLPDGRRINLELDVAAHDWDRLIRRERLPVVLITLLISVLIIGFFQAQERLRESARLTSLSEAQMRTARDAAEAATRAKSDFLAVMSHELRTPLAGVIGMLDLLRRSPPTEARNKYLTVARDSAETLLRLLDDILDSAKIEAGRLTLESIAFRPRDAFQHLCEAAHLRAETKSVDFQATITDAVPEVLVGDPTRLRQVLGNLQNNALKFTEHGEVRVTIDAQPLDPEHVRLTIAVRDTGCGISPEHRQRLFGKFEQADRSTTRRYGGTGLGLSIVKALADSMGGTVSVESELGRGSTFTFSAPLPIGAPADAPSKADADSLPSTPAPVRLKILCAEDDAVNRIVAEAVISQLGHQVEFADNGETALALLRQHRYDLVLMDGRMPVLDGFRATRCIRRGEAGVLDPQIYICAATANVAEADRQRCTAAGMNDYVKKPLSLRSVAEALARATAWLAEQQRTPVLGSTPATTPVSGGLSEAELLAVLDEPAWPPSDATDPVTAGFNATTINRLADLFWQQVPDQLTALRSAHATGDTTRIGNIAHTMKSSAFYAGARDLSRLFSELENLAATGDASACTSALEHLAAQLERSRPATSPSAPSP